MNDEMTIEGVVVEGHGVSSGQGTKDGKRDERFPAGTLTLQAPFFLDAGLDLSIYHHGTINLDLSPLYLEVVEPKYHFPKVKWTELFPPEDFSFSPCVIFTKGGPVQALIYYPHPETKPDHLQSEGVVEILAPFVREISPGAELKIAIRTSEVEILSRQ